jgi:hypothetical protein
MDNIIEFHENLKITPSSHRQVTGKMVRQKEEEGMELVVQGRETFTVMHQMMRLDQETMQKPFEDMEQFEVFMAQIPTKELYKIHSSLMQEV